VRQAIHAANAFVVIVAQVSMLALALEQRVYGWRFVAQVPFVVGMLRFFAMRFQLRQLFETFHLIRLLSLHRSQSLKVGINCVVIFIIVLVNRPQVQFARSKVAFSA